MAGWASQGLTAAQLSDGRIQLWATDASGRIWSNWQIQFDWIYWQSPWTPSLPTFHTQSLAVAPLSDKRLQFWAVDTAGTIWSCWKSSTNANATWTPWASQWTAQPPPFKSAQAAAAPLSDGRLQFWAVDTSGKIWSCWKSATSSSSAWTPWVSQWTPQPPPFTATEVAAAPLSDGRLQFWAVDTTGKIWSCWKSNTNASSAWTAWTSQWTAQPPPFNARQVAAAQLSDKRLQFWAVDTAGKLWSCWKSSTNSSSAWTPWTQAWIADTPTFVTRTLWPAKLSDGRLQVWLIDSQGEIRTTFKTTTDSNAPWSNWSLAFAMMRQEQTNWCWAGCSVGTSHFYNQASAWTQCSLANAELNKTTCCQDPGPCNVYGFLNTALQTVGNFDHMTYSAEADATITAQAQAGQPLGVRVAWSGGGAHFIMVVGGGPNNMVYVKDPWYGASYITYNTLKNSYQGSGSWTHSYFTKQ